jgi:ribonuclease BN (tRNA processing enzyme)
MELRILGSGVTIPTAHRGTTGYALVADDGSVLIVDCGPGSTRRWPAAGFGLTDVLGVVNTHHHVDHCADLAIYLFARSVMEPPMDARVDLVGPVGHGGFVSRLAAAFAPGVGDTTGSVVLTELGDGESHTVGPFHVQGRVVAHIPGALGVRVTCDEATFAFSGDTGPCEALVDLCRDVDLALVECSYAETRESRAHLNPKTAAEAAIAANVRSLVLTHFYPEADATDVASAVRRAGYHGPLTLANDGMRLRIAHSGGTA